MAEGLLGGILGEEEEKTEVEAREALAGAEAFASAVAARLTGNDPGVARKTEAFLDKQTQLIETQNEHLKDEHSLRLEHLRNVLREETTRRIGLRLRVGMQCFFGLAAICIGIAFSLMVRDAIHSKGIVIEQFEVSPNLAANVPSGRIIAAGLLDQITKLQAGTRMVTDTKSDLAGAWNQEASVNIPESGLSINELEQFLKHKLGHDIHISGDVVRTSAPGVALTVRGSNLVPRTFMGPQDGLDDLLQQAAEYLYGEANPRAFTQYLDDRHEYHKELEFLRSHINKAATEDLPWMYVWWGGTLVAEEGMSRLPEGKSLMQRAIKAAPDYLSGYDNLLWLTTTGGEENAAVGLLDAATRAGLNPTTVPVFDQLTNDFESQQQHLKENMAQTSGTGTLAGAQPQLVLAFLSARRHDVPNTHEFLDAASDSSSEHDILMANSARAIAASEQADLLGATKYWDQALAVTNAAVWIYDGFPDLSCFAAVDYEKAAMPRKADAALSAIKGILGVDSYVNCYSAHGDILDLRGDWVGAQSWYAKAIRLAPRLPAGYYASGVALFRHGDLDGAVAALKSAHEKGPRWADPLKVWGDVLVKQGNAKEALLKYDEALKYAPNWKQLHEARDALAKQKS